MHPDFTTKQTNSAQITVDSIPCSTGEIENPTQRIGDSRPGRIFELEKPWLEPQNNGGAK